MSELDDAIGEAINIIKQYNKDGYYDKYIQRIIDIPLRYKPRWMRWWAGSATTTGKMTIWLPRGWLNWEAGILPSTRHRNAQNLLHEAQHAFDVQEKGWCKTIFNYVFNHKTRFEMEFPAYQQDVRFAARMGKIQNYKMQDPEKNYIYWLAQKVIRVSSVNYEEYFPQVFEKFKEIVEAEQK